jgi:hypothetical protein
VVARTSTIGVFNTGDIWSESVIDSLPAGWLGYVERSTDVTGVTTVAAITTMTVTVTLNASRRVRVTGRVSGMTATNVDTVSQLNLMEGSTTLDYGRSPTAFASLSYNGPTTVMAVLTPSAGAHTYFLSVERLVGSGTVSIAAGSDRKMTLLVEDLGPSA